MNAPSGREVKPPLSQARIPEDVFAALRKENLARWPTGNGVDLDEAVALHQAMPKHKQLAWVLRRAVAERRCLTQPRGGFGTFELQRKLMETLDREGLADIVPTTTDSYTRNEQFALAQKGIEESEREGRSMLNGYPLVNYGVSVNRQLIDAIDKPAIMLTGTAMPKLTGEIGFASGYSGYLGSGKDVWRTTPAGAIRAGDWKLIEFFETGTIELYNLAEDIGEKTDLAQKMPERAKQLHDHLLAWRKKVNAQMPTKRAK